MNEQNELLTAAMQIILHAGNARNAADEALVLWICKFGNAQGESCSGYELNVIASVVLGGVFITGGSGKVGGVVLGVLLFGTLNNILPLIQVSSFWQMGIKGFVIIASVVINSITQQHMDKKALQGRD